MIDIQQLTELISAFRVETEKSAIKWVQCQTCLNIAEREKIMQYGLWQDYGTGRETPRGNSGDLGRAKRRQRRRWFSRKYYASVMRLKEFYEENIGEAFAGIMSDFARRANSRTQSGSVWEKWVIFAVIFTLVNLMILCEW